MSLTAEQRKWLHEAGMTDVIARHDQEDGRATAGHIPTLTQHVQVDEMTGRKAYTYTGDKSCWMNEFKSPGYVLDKFVIEKRHYANAMQGRGYLNGNSQYGADGTMGADGTTILSDSSAIAKPGLLATLFGNK